MGTFIRSPFFPLLTLWFIWGIWIIGTSLHFGRLEWMWFFSSRTFSPWVCIVGLVWAGREMSHEWNHRHLTRRKKAKEEVGVDSLKDGQKIEEIEKNKVDGQESKAQGRPFIRRAYGNTLLQKCLLFALTLIGIWLLQEFLFHFKARRYYGDAGAIVGFLKHKVLFHKREPLSPALYLGVHNTFGTWFQWSALHTIQRTTSFFGALGIVSLGLIVKEVFSSSPLRTSPSFSFPSSDKKDLFLLWLSFLAMGLSLGSMELFFGYVENYTLPTVCALWSIWCVLKAYRLKEQRTLSDFSKQSEDLNQKFEWQNWGRMALLLWSIGIGFHLSLSLFTPAYLWFILSLFGGIYSRKSWRGWRSKDIESRKQDLKHIFSAFCFVIIPLLILKVCMEWKGYLRAEEVGFGGGDGRMFVPWSIDKKTPYLHYSFLSLGHLKAIFNQQRLVGPMNLIMSLSVFFWLFRKNKALLFKPSLIYMFLLSFAFLTLTLIWNPDLGPKRDWDLFGPVGFYLYILSLLLLRQIKEVYPGFPLLWVGWSVVWINLSQSGAFFLHNRGW